MSIYPLLLASFRKATHFLLSLSSGKHVGLRFHFWADEKRETFEKRLDGLKKAFFTWLLLLKDVVFLRVHTDTDRYCVIQVNTPKRFFLFEKAFKDSLFRRFRSRLYALLEFSFLGGVQSIKSDEHHSFSSQYTAAQCAQSGSDFPLRRLLTAVNELRLCQSFFSLCVLPVCNTSQFILH